MYDGDPYLYGEVWSRTVLRRAVSNWAFTRLGNDFVFKPAGDYHNVSEQDAELPGLYLAYKKVAPCKNNEILKEV